MGLKFSDALRLSWSNISGHKVRSIIIILSISVLFGFIMGFNFIMNGLERTALELNQDATGGATYVSVQEIDHKHYHNSPVINEISNLPNFDKQLKQSEFDAIKERASRFHGEVVGYTWRPFFNYYFVSQSAVTDFITTDLSTVPEGKIPALVLEGLTLEDYCYPEEDPAACEHFSSVFYPVGALPRVTIRENPDDPDDPFSSPTLPDPNLLNLLLSKIRFYPLGSDFMIIDDGSGKVERFVRQESEYILMSSIGWVQASDLNIHPVIKFTDPYDAVAFASPVSFLGITFYPSDHDFLVQDFLGGAIEIASEFNMIRALLAFLEVLFIIVSVLIAIFTFKHLIDQDAATIALYRSMGASTGNIYLIYFLYFLELCLLAIISCFVIAFLIVGIITLTNGKALGLRLEEYYRLDHLPHIYFFSFDEYFWTVIVAILLVAPLALGFSTHRFKGKYIARKLKED